MIERAGPFLDELLKLPQRRLAVISHGMIGRVLVGTLLGMSENDMFTFGQANDTVFHLTQHEDRFLTQHFVGGDGPFEGLPPRQY
jgi:broad specificity phosphatase PhoE